MSHDLDCSYYSESLDFGRSDFAAFEDAVWQVICPSVALRISAL